MKKTIFLTTVLCILTSTCYAEDNSLIRINQRLVAANTKTVILPSNPSTGFHWNITDSENTQIVSSEFIPSMNEHQNNNKIVGNGGYEKFKISLINPNKSGTMVLKYKRSWEDTSPSDTVIKVEIPSLNNK